MLRAHRIGGHTWGVHPHRRRSAHGRAAEDPGRAPAGASRRAAETDAGPEATASGQPPTDGWERGRAREPTRANRRWLQRATTGAVGLAVVAVVVWLPGGEGVPGGSAESDGDDVERLTIDPAAPETPETVDPGVPGPEADEGEGATSSSQGAATTLRRLGHGGWEPLPDAPLEPRRDAAGAWTGRHFVVWGGRALDDGGWRADGAAYDPEADRWERLPDAPSSATRDAAAVAVEDAVVVLGAEGGRAFSLDVAAGAWQERERPPSGAWRWQRAAADGEVVSVPGHGADGTPAVARLDADGWRELPGPPLARILAVAPAHDGLVALGFDAPAGPGPDAQPVAMATVWDGDEWSEPDPAPFTGPWVPSAAPDTVTGGVVAAGPGHDRGTPHAVMRWSRAAGWEQLPSLALPVARADPQPHALSDGGVVVWTPDAPAAARAVHHADAVAGDRDASGTLWAPLGTGSPTVGAGPASAWSGDALFVWGRGGGAVWTPRGARVSVAPPDTERWDGQWRRLPPPPSPRRDPVLAPAGDELLAWGGTDDDGVPRADGLAYSPAEDAWEAVPPAPVPGRRDAAAVFTGDELVVWGGRSADGRAGDGAAYDPTAGTWRVLPPAPIGPAAQPAAVWDGERVVVVTTDEATAYDPDTDAWEPLPAPPGHRAPAALSLAGAEVRLLADAEGQAALVATLGADGWRVREIPGVGGEPRPAAGGTDAPAALWGDGGGLLGRDVGTALRPPWDAGRGPTAWVAGRLVVWEGTTIADAPHGRPGAAAFEPDTRNWAVLPSPPWSTHADAAATVAGEVVFWSNAGEPFAFRPAAQ